MKQNQTDMVACRADLKLGDCLALLPVLADNSIDMVFMDPPYGYNFNNGDLASRWEAALGRGDYVPQRDNRPILNDGKEADQLFRCATAEVARVLKPGGVLCCCCGGGGGPNPQCARWPLWIEKPLQLKQVIVWDKGPMGMGWHYRRSYETVLVAHKKGAKCAWYDTSHRVENIIRHIRKIVPRQNQHPTVKPVALVSHFLRLHTREGDTVLDPFMGSGTTGVACLQMNRRFIGMELSPEFFQMAQERIAKEGGV